MEKRLIDVVNELPQYSDEDKDAGVWDACINAIEKWIDEKQRFWESEITTKIPNDKISIFLWNELEDTTRDFIAEVGEMPMSGDEWEWDWNCAVEINEDGTWNYEGDEKGKVGYPLRKNYYYVMALKLYLLTIQEVLSLYMVDEDKYTKSINEREWFFSWLEDEGEQGTAAPQPTKEPQQEQPEQGQTAPTIPTINDTDKERRVFGNALKKKYMSLNNGCYKWTLTKSLLAYMCGKLYCGDRIKENDSDYSIKYIKGNTQMPAQEVKALFGVDVASNRYSIKAPPRNSWKVDELFKSNGASK